MPFEIIPAIDLLEGKCVRLTRGEFAQKTVYSEDPVKVAREFAQKGAQRLHVVDLDGAKSGLPINHEIIAKIAAAINIPIEVGGGIRTHESVKQYLDLGVDRVILGTAIAHDPQLIKSLCAEFGEKIVIGIDARNGLLAISGWKETTDKTALDLAKEVVELGAKRIIYTDISRDGTLSGPNLSATQEIAKATLIPVIASGGVSSLDDVRKLKALLPFGVEGCIIGRAIYTGAVKIEEVLAIGA